MRVNFKEKPEWLIFWFYVLWMPFVFLFIAFLIESVLIRFISDISPLNYFVTYFIFLFFMVIIFFALFLLEFETEYRCICCRKIFLEKEMVIIEKESEAEGHVPEVCKSCFIKLAKTIK